MLAVGILCGCVAAGAWFKPNSPFMSHLLYDRYPTQREATRFQSIVGYTRETMGPVSLWNVRIVGTLGALVFGGFGLGLIVSSLQTCGGLDLPLANHVALVLRIKYWPPMLAFIGAALAFAGYYQAKIRPGRKLAFIALVASWAFAGSEAAAFHGGAIANTWGILAVVLWISFALAAWRWREER